MFDGTVSLRPSIGNGQQECRSHYNIRGDGIEWMRPMTTEATRAARRRDDAALRASPGHATVTPSRWWRRALAFLRQVVGRGRRAG